MPPDGNNTRNGCSRSCGAERLTPIASRSTGTLCITLDWRARSVAPQSRRRVPPDRLIECRVEELLRRCQIERWPCCRGSIIRLIERLGDALEHLEDFLTKSEQRRLACQCRIGVWEFAHVALITAKFARSRRRSR